MRWLDRRLRDARFARAEPYVDRGDVVVDVGCADGEMFRQWDATIGPSVGFDPDVERPTTLGRHQLRPGTFPTTVDLDGLGADVIVMLAVLEHVPPAEHDALVAACAEVVRPGGRVVVTVPSPMVDHILDVLIKLRIVDGMHADEHHGFEPADTVRIFEGEYFELIRHRRFQLGLNNLYVFGRR